MKNRQIFDDVIACDLWFKPPQSKILATPINWRLPENLFEDLFFLENNCGCVLGPWPWPRAFLSLTSRGSVLGKAVIGFGLGLGFFLCSWPRALCPRLHLCLPLHNFLTINFSFFLAQCDLLVMEFTICKHKRRKSDHIFANTVIMYFASL